MTGTLESEPGSRAALHERGATSVEYALMILLVAGVIIGVIGFLGQDVQGLFASVNW